METTMTFRVVATVGTALPFTGTSEEATANFATHDFDPHEGRCWHCDCRPWGVWANHPCGNGDRIENQRIQFEDGTIATRVVKIVRGEIVATREPNSDTETENW